MKASLHHLQLFYYVAKAQGISAAVKVIPFKVQQPAVSQQVKQLEADLGTILFERRPFKLTPAGEKLYKFLSSFFDNLENELSSAVDEIGVRVSFGCPSIISENYFPELIAAMKGEFSNLIPTVREVEGDSVFDSIVEHEIDLAVTLSNIPSSKRFQSKEIARLPMSIVVPANHRFAKQGFWAKSDLPNEKWVALQGNTGGNSDLIEGMAELGVSADFAVSTNSVEAALKYVMMGLGICLMAKPPKSLLEEKGLVAVPAVENFGEAALSVVWLSDSNVSSKILNYFIKQVRESAHKYIL